MFGKNLFRRPIPANVYLTAILLVSLFSVPIITSNPTVLTILTYTFLFAYYTSSWNILGRLAGQISFGHAAYFGLGAYVSTFLFLHYGLSPWIGMFIGGICAMVVSILLGFPSFRVRGLFYIMMTFAFAEILRILFVYPLRDISGGDEGLPISLWYESPYYFQFISKWPYYYIALILMLVLIYVMRKLEKSRLGYFFKAIREDEDAAASIGINVLRCKLIAASVSGFLSGIAGTFYVQFICYIGPNDVFSLMTSFRPLVISWVGGPGVFGPVLGSFILTPLSELLVLAFGGMISGLHLILYSITLTFVVMFLPYGAIEPLTKYVLHPISQLLTKITIKE